MTSYGSLRRQAIVETFMDFSVVNFDQPNHVSHHIDHAATSTAATSTAAIMIMLRNMLSFLLDLLQV